MNANDFASDNSGSVTTVPAEGGNAGQTGTTTGELIPKEQYLELEKKLGAQGNELGESRKEIEEYKKFFDDVNPLLAKLDAQPDLVEAILQDKINSDLIKAVSEGKISLEDAKKVSEAHEEVKKEVGKKYESLDPSVITKLIEEQVLKAMSEKSSSLEKKVMDTLSESDKRREYESKVNDFISKTPDFSQFAPSIDKYLDEHPSIDDIQVAYDAVKGKFLQQEMEKNKEIQAAEEAKRLALNAGGGYSRNTQVINDKSIVDKLIGGVSNPNVF